MKTSELRKWLQENNMFFRENELTIGILDSVTVDKKYPNKIRVSTNMFGTNGINMLKKMIEYAETPIEKREDEKKYYVRLNDYFYKGSDLNYMKCDEQDKEFCFSDNQEFHTVITKYTEKQINEFPSEVKGAIECGFLKKVEVDQ